ncbi:ABC transporter substrate binding protein, partial [Roseibium sp.]
MSGSRLLLAFAILLFSIVSAVAEDGRRTILSVFYEGCEHLCQGFQDAIAESGFPADVVVRDIDQDKTRLPAIVAEAKETRPDLVLTFGTSVTLGVIGTLNDVGSGRFLEDIPVVFTVVADPFGTNIAESFEASGRPNVAGTFNRAPESVQVAVIRQYDPTFQKLGLLYHSNERNSVLKKEELEALAPT